MCIGPPTGDVAIDVLRGSINPDDNNSVIPVCIAGTDSFDVTNIDRTTLAFGPDGAAPTHRALGHLSDVCGDSNTDLLTHYRTSETGIAEGDTEACLTGLLLDGTPFEACDSIRTKSKEK